MKTFTYTKGAVLCAFALPLFTLAVVLISNCYVVVGLLRQNYTDLGLIAILAAILVFSCIVALKLTDIIKTTIILDDQGITYHSILKNMVIPWQDIVRIERVDLTTHGDVPNPHRRRDLKIRTRNYGTIYAFHFLHLAGQGNDAIEQFIFELTTNTQLKLSGQLPE